MPRRSIRSLPYATSDVSARRQAQEPQRRCNRPCVARSFTAPAGGQVPFARLMEISFPSLKAVQETAALPGAQKTIAHAVEITTGGAPHFMIVEEEGWA